MLSWPFVSGVIHSTLLEFREELYGANHLNSLKLHINVTAAKLRIYFDYSYLIPSNDGPTFSPSP